MAKCEFCDKGVTFGIKVSHSHRRTNRAWKPNVKRVKAIVDGLPPQRQGHPRCVILILFKLPETSLSAEKTGFFRFYGGKGPGAAGSKTLDRRRALWYFLNTAPPPREDRAEAKGDE